MFILHVFRITPSYCERITEDILFNTMLRKVNLSRLFIFRVSLLLYGSETNNFVINFGSIKTLFEMSTKQNKKLEWKSCTEHFEVNG